MILGEDYLYTFDSADRLALVDPDSWAYVNGNLANYYCLDYYYDETTGDWNKTGYINGTVNGLSSQIMVYFDQDNPSGVIYGYYLTVDDEADYSSCFSFNDDDVLDLAIEVVLSDGSFETVMMEEPFLYSQVDFSYLSNDDDGFSEYATYGCYHITDVYGNDYYTDLLPLGSRGSLQ